MHGTMKPSPPARSSSGRFVEMTREDHAVREMKLLPQWAMSNRHPQNTACPKCVGWISLSCKAVMILCASSDHIPVDGRGRSRRLIRGRILKKFPKPGRPVVVFYDLKWKRALRVRRPLLWYITSDLRSYEEYGFFYAPEATRFKKYPLTDREWMLATAILYYLEGDACAI